MRQRGITLVEVLIALYMITIGMTGLFWVLTSATRTSMRANQIMQAVSRNQLIMEGFYRMPIGVLPGCLNYTGDCEGYCKSALGANAVNEACVFHDLTRASPSLSTDTTGQTYGARGQLATDMDASDVTAGRANGVVYTPGTYGTSANGHLVSVATSIVWNDDGTATMTAGGSADHKVNMIAHLYR